MRDHGKKAGEKCLVVLRIFGFRIGGFTPARLSVATAGAVGLRTGS